MSNQSVSQKTCRPSYNNALTNAAVALKAGPGHLFKVTAFQPAANAATYIQWYNVLQADVVVGTTLPVYVMYIPAGAGATIEEFIDNTAPFFDVAISYAATTTPTGAGAPANAIQISLLYA
jgi:hypothetical protein